MFVLKRRLQKKLERDARIFCIGLSRTGSCSLTKALHKLGYKIVHFPCDQETIQQLMSEDFKLKLLDGVDGISDIVAAAYYKNFFEKYPGSRFILTMRDKRDWLTSYKAHYERHRHDWFQNNFVKYISMKVYKTCTYDEELLGKAYDRHIKESKSFLQSNRASLLTLDICSGEGWEKLCSFLECEPPKQNFPWYHASGSKPWEELKK